MRKYLALAMVLLVLGLAGMKIYQEVIRPAEAPTGPGSRALAVTVEPVRTADLYKRAELSGTLIAEKEFIVAPKVSGRLEKLYVDIGDEVVNGRLIAEINSEEFTQEVLIASAELEVARAGLAESASELSLFEKELERAKRLFERETLSLAEMDQIQSAYDVRRARHEVALAQLRQREASLEAARVRLEYTRIKASWEGGDLTRRVGRRFAGEGDMLQANEPIVSIVGVHNLIAVVNVIERDYPHISTGQSALIRADARADTELEGRVIRIAPLLETETRQARAEILIPNQEGLLAPGMFVRVRIILDQSPNAIAVPRSALARREGEQGVFMAGTDLMQARFVPVKTGIRDGDLIEIREPLLEGLVVTTGHHLLEDGADIIIPGDAG